MMDCNSSENPFPGFKAIFSEMRGTISTLDNMDFEAAFDSGKLEIEMHHPKTVTRDRIHPHDEVYVIVAGCGYMKMRQNKHFFQAGDYVFVAAGTPHRMEDCSDNIAVWVIYCKTGRDSKAA